MEKISKGEYIQEKREKHEEKIVRKKGGKFPKMSLMRTRRGVGEISVDQKLQNIFSSCNFRTRAKLNRYLFFLFTMHKNVQHACRSFDFFSFDNAVTKNYLNLNSWQHFSPEFSNFLRYICNM